MLLLAARPKAISRLRFVISLEEDTESASIALAGKIFNLIKNKATALWESRVSFEEVGDIEILASAEDLLGHKTENKKIGLISVKDRGRVTSLDNGSVNNAKITIFVLNEDNNSWAEWQADIYAGENPIFTNDIGQYELILPSGKYYIVIQKNGFKRLKTLPFDLNNSKFIVSDFRLEPRSGFRGFVEDLLEKISI